MHGVDFAGHQLGEFKLKDSKNRDWEDLASFTHEGKPYLMVADIGDNDAKRKHRTLYFVEEPLAEKNGEAPVAWSVNYRYPDGPRDAESAAVDTESETVLILSKRDLPPVLYSVPLRPAADEVVEAQRLGPMTSLRRPSRQEVESAPANKSWDWQPVGMDISADNRAAVILTYEEVYYYERQADQNWLDALNGTAFRVSLGNFENAESIAFGDADRTVFVTGENKHSRLLRADLREAGNR